MSANENEHTEIRDDPAYEPPAAEDLDTDITPAATSAAAPGNSQI